MEIVREELSILSLSHLGYSSRKQMGPMVAPGEVPHSYISYLAVGSRDETLFGMRLLRTAPIAQMVLDWRWKNYQDTMFFTKLLKILRGETQVDDGWRNELRRASVMIGQSVGANDLLKSFVWNMVALELLLTKEQGKLLDTLPTRVEAFLGWILYWEHEDYGRRIKDVYLKRNRLLHQGRQNDITQQDLAFTDHLLLNLLTNLVRHPKLFCSKDHVIAFSEGVEAERVLVVKPRVRPKTLRFTRPFKPDF